MSFLFNLIPHQYYNPPRQHDNAPKQLLVIPINHNTPTYSSNAFAMSLFKRSNKTKTAFAASSVASVASTPNQTPRPSIQEQRFPLATQMTRDQALEKIMKKTYGGALNGPLFNEIQLMERVSRWTSFSSIEQA